MKRLLMAVLVAIPFAASAASGDLAAKCSTKADKTAKKADLQALAKIKPDEAKSIALKSAGGGSIAKGGIETEDGCLIYSYHVKNASGKGQTEVFVDAGNGAVLGSEGEGAVRTAMEKPVDKTKELAGKAKEKVTGEPSTNHSMPK
jgi:uncharacterized membrane protein YkoI